MSATSTGLDPREVGIELRIGRVGRENVPTKARRLLVEGRLQIRLYSPGEIRAICRGTEEVHRLGFERGSWWCSCPARGPLCSHLAALQLVASKPEGER